MSAEARLSELGLVLPSPPEPIASYVTFVRTGSLGYTSGHGPLRVDGSWITGRVGEDLDTEAAHEAARVVGLGLLATLRSNLGSLDEVARVVKVLGLVNCTADYRDQPAVINGCSDLFFEIFGEAGRHARSAVGVGSLPMNLPVEIEAIVEIREEGAEQ
jgi:enamine deaminase RidA (YjgF/YER057c/UK114 family)